MFSWIASYRQFPREAQVKAAAETDSVAKAAFEQQAK
jgi:hypothetical protein